MMANTLPHPFGEGPANGHAMALSPDGRRLLVADVTSGTVAEISTEKVAVRRTAPLPPGAGPAYAVAGRDRLFLGAGTTLRTVDLGGLGVAAERSVRDPITGLVRSLDGARLDLGQASAVSWHDPATGKELGPAAVSGLVGLRAPATPA
ncbi:hypothetical protein [Micromonospora sp. KC723]|uniref:hypothetical protein n=1 Tax=Micromonospora sp. KC723 TaxID=2530381 RepID=UPI001050AABC|nr:hypothetical protein [Micromonospora sp. KC723]TDB70344.1 hypothetical protein E1165_26010 [Micromonospora sp. KC723]